MRKRLYIIFIVVFFLLVLAGCSSAESPSAPVPESSTAPSEQPEITQDELYRQFEQVYDDFGASVAQDQEQLAVELEALEKNSANSEAIWPLDYKTLYESWRADTIEKRAIMLQQNYEEIIAGQELYEIGVDGLWEARPGLIFADYIDLEQDGISELLLLTWLGSNDDVGHQVRAELYHGEKGQAIKSFEKDISFFSSDANISLSVYNGQTFLSVYFSDGGSGAERSQNEFYAMSQTGIEAADILYYEWEKDYETMQGTEVFYALYEDNIRVEITADEYNLRLGQYELGERLVNLGYVGAGPTTWQTGILPAFEVPVPKIEVNGKLLELDVAPYAHNRELMAPLRDVLEAMGVAVYANSDASVILASTKSDTLVITYKGFFNWPLESINSTYYGSDKTYKYSMNGGRFQNIMIEFTNGKAFLPLKTIVPLFGATVEWDGKARAMQITSNIPDSSRMTQDELKKVASFDMNQASKIAVNKGYKGVGGDAPTTCGGYRPDDYTIHANGGLVFKNGKAVWSLYVVEREEFTPPPYASHYAELYRVDVASDGAVTAYPNDRCITGAGQW